MSVSCADRERIFLDGTPEEWAELECHAASCAACATEVRGWQELSMAAQELRDHRKDPVLWSRIAKSLTANGAGNAPGVETKTDAARIVGREGSWLQQVSAWSGRRPSARGLSLGWQTALAGALAVTLFVGGISLYVHEHRTAVTVAKSPFLNDRTLAEVERTENAYMQAIDKMAAEAKPAMDGANSPLMDSYREKLMVLDSAIGELRAQAGENPSNAHLRYQLLAMYREKQDTLREILENK
jgi:hypothetical protein